MDERQLVAFLFRSFASEEFRSKSDMARQLGIPLRTLQWIFENLDTLKGATVGFQRFIGYCCEQEIDLMPYFRRYNQLSQRKVSEKKSRADFGKESDASDFMAQILVMFRILLNEICSKCGRQERRDHKCSIDHITDKFMESQTRKGTNSMKTNTEIGALRWLCLEIRREYFKGSTVIMASNLEMTPEDVQNALEIEGARIVAEVFERAVVYCQIQGLSLDKLLARYQTKEYQLRGS